MFVTKKLAGLWYCRKWWGARLLSFLLSEKWLYKRHILRRAKQDEQQFWNPLKRCYDQLARPLRDEEWEKLNNPNHKIYPCTFHSYRYYKRCNR